MISQDMVKMVTDHAAAKKDSGVRFQGVEEQMAAIQLSFSRFNHEAKLLEATHEEFKVQQTKYSQHARPIFTG
jgi:hypothetical protein